MVEIVSIVAMIFYLLVWITNLTKNIDWLTILNFVVAIVAPITAIYYENNNEVSMYYKSVTTMFHSPTFWLCLILMTGMYILTIFAFLRFNMYFQGNPLFDNEYRRKWQEKLAQTKLAESSSPFKATEFTDLVSVR